MTNAFDANCYLMWSVYMVYVRWVCYRLSALNIWQSALLFTDVLAHSWPLILKKIMIHKNSIFMNGAYTKSEIFKYYVNHVKNFVIFSVYMA